MLKVLREEDSLGVSSATPLATAIAGRSRRRRQGKATTRRSVPKGFGLGRGNRRLSI